MVRSAKATLLLLFVHGFKGHDHHTFLDFPNRIRTILTNANLQLDVEAIAYPQYDTRGDFDVAVKNFVEWVKMTVKDHRDFNAKQHARELAEGINTDPNSKPTPVYVCLLGHSMGGLVAADAALYFQAQPEESPIIGLLAYDTPYFGLNHTIFTEAAYQRVNSFAKEASGVYTAVSSILPSAAAAGASLWSAKSMAETPTAAAAAEVQGDNQNRSSSTGTTPSTSRSSTGSTTSSWMSSLLSTTTTNKNTNVKKQEPAAVSSSTNGSSGWGWGSVAVGVGALVAATTVAVVANKHLQNGMSWVTSHIQFVGTLWDNNKLAMRMANVLLLPLSFHCFYTQVKIPASASNGFRSEYRTFIELTAIPEKIRPYFSPRNCSGQDEIEAHTEMFNPSKNIDYYQMGEDTVKALRVMVDKVLGHSSMNQGK
ncbi:hypothetical protein BGW42_004638 [Actinomortierella wolfii]|nr:hypothetical protein BGW42_004638 [Actinomortierella wolfii]